MRLRIERHGGRSRDDDARRHIAAHDEGVAARPAVKRGHHPCLCAEHVEGVVAFHAVDCERLDAGEGDIDASAVDAVLGNDEHVVRRGADDYERVESGTPLDGDRGVEIVFDRVGPRPALHADVRARRDQEGADYERVVAAAAVHVEVGLVGIDLEGVRAGAAVEHGRLVDAVGQVAGGLRRQHGRERVSGKPADVSGERVASREGRRGVKLSDLEPVVAVARVDGQQRGIAVHGVIVSGTGNRAVDIAAIDGQHSADRAIVIDALVDRSALRVDVDRRLVRNRRSRRTASARGRSGRQTSRRR